MAATLAVTALVVGVAVGTAATNQTRSPATFWWASTNSGAAIGADVSPEEAEKAIASAKDLSTAFRVAAAKVLPSVVTIETSARAMAAADNKSEKPRGNDPFEGRNPFEGTPFEDMFRDTPFGKGFRFEMPPQGRSPRSQGIGSGVIVDASGLILTNNHVVSGGDRVTVRLNDGREFEAVDVWSDPKTDIAVVRIEGAKDLVAAELGDSNAVTVGDWVLALGQPFGLESSVTAGIISAKQRGIGITARENFLQTDAAINPGNSGGPLVNLDGQVIGINTAISSRSGGNDGVGFAVPINLAKWVGGQLSDGGVVKRAYLGVGIQPVTQQLADQFQVKPREGVVVTDVYADTPAAKAGLKSGDVIVELNGQAVSSPLELQTAVERAEFGKSHKLTVIRDGKRRTLKFTPEEQPENFGTKASAAQSSTDAEPSKLGNLGLEISELDASVAEKLGMKDASGVVITGVKSGSPAAEAGLETGMVITEVNRKAVKTVEEVVQAVKEKSEEGVLLLVRSSTGSRFVVIRP
jgi:serine protease Do